MVKCVALIFKEGCGACHAFRGDGSLTDNQSKQGYNFGSYKYTPRLFIDIITGKGNLSPKDYWVVFSIYYHFLPTGAMPTEFSEYQIYYFEGKDRKNRPGIKQRTFTAINGITHLQERIYTANGEIFQSGSAISVNELWDETVKNEMPPIQKVISLSPFAPGALFYEVDETSHKKYHRFYAQDLRVTYSRIAPYHPIDVKSQFDPKSSDIISRLLELEKSKDYTTPPKTDLILVNYYLDMD